MSLVPCNTLITASFLMFMLWLPWYGLMAQTISPITTISINAVYGLQYDVVRFTVKPGAKVRIVLTNRDEMAHNLVFTALGARIDVVNAAMDLREDGPSKNYIPETAKVLWSIPMIDPGKSDSVMFTAPRRSGIYPYVCTITGHGLIMYGAMYVTNGRMPPIADDDNIPENRRNDSTTKTSNKSRKVHSGHPYTPQHPYLYRVLLPDAGPAAIAVSLSNNLSYCWDAGSCRLRYAWSGEFLEMNDYWTIKLEEHARILGKVFYRDLTEFPLRVNNPNNLPVVNFKGYNLINKFPEFHYTIDGIDVREIIRPKTDGSGLIRTFTIKKSNELIWFVFSENDGVYYESSVGKFEKKRLKLSPTEAREFTITMTRKEGLHFE